MGEKTPADPRGALCNLVGKAAAALLGIPAQLSLWDARKTATWLAENLWALAIAAGILLLVVARDWIAR